MNVWTRGAVLLTLALAPFVAARELHSNEDQRTGDDLLLFDFEAADDLAAWTNLKLEGAKEKVPPARFERSTENATSGKHSLKITFGGGAWPTLTTTSVPADWNAWHTFAADVTANRPCVVGFTVLQERSERGEGYEAATSRWTRTVFLKAGKNQVSAALRPAVGNALEPKRGNVVRLEFFMYNHVGCRTVQSSLGGRRSEHVPVRQG